MKLLKIKNKIIQSNEYKEFKALEVMKKKMTEVHSGEISELKHKEQILKMSRVE